MCASSIVELPFPKRANSCSHLVSKSTFAIHIYIYMHIYIYIYIYMYILYIFWGFVKSCQEGCQFVSLPGRHGWRIVCGNPGLRCEGWGGGGTSLAS